ncbi:ABC transporter permease [Bacillota bacterium LX-D]|nr:ABC transporter permease [Bacillota bacterium LX-D]
MAKTSFSRLMGRELTNFQENKMVLLNMLFTITVVFLIGFVYSAAVVDEIPAGIVDLDHTSLSKNIVRQFTENNKFQTTTISNYAALNQLLKTDQVDVGIVIPPGLTEEIKKQQGGKMLLIVDGTNYIVANSAYVKANEILLTMNGGITLQTLEGKGILPAEAEKLVQNIQFKQKLLYNPTNNYSYYLTYGIIATGIFSLMMTASAITLAQKFLKHGKASSKELLASMIVFAIFVALSLNICFLTAGFYFSLPLENYQGFLPISIGAAMLVAILGVLLFVLARNELAIFQAGVFFSTTFIFITGFTWPVQSFPPFLLPIYYLCPLSPILNGIRASLIMGLDSAYLVKYFIWLGCLIVLYLPLGIWLYAKKA